MCQAARLQSHSIYISQPRAVAALIAQGARLARPAVVTP
jgi:hypothetical protein